MFFVIRNVERAVAGTQFAAGTLDKKRAEKHSSGVMGCKLGRHIRIFHLVLGGQFIKYHFL